MIDRKLLVNELISLGSLRVQKVFGLFNSILVVELYSPRFKRLYLVVDQNPKTRSVHVQTKKPIGFKTKSLLITMLAKYAENAPWQFYAVDDEGDTLKAVFTREGQDFSLLIETFPRLAVGLFRGHELMASLKKGVAPSYRDHRPSAKDIGHELAENEKAGLLHQEKLLVYHQKALFEHRVAALKKELEKKEALLKNVEGDYLKCQKNLGLAHDAELIKQNLYAIRRGMKSITVTDYGTGEASERTLELDPKLSPQDFLVKMFSKIKRAKRGLALIEPRLITIKDEISTLKKDLMEYRKNGPTSIDIGAIANNLQAKRERQKKVPAERLPYRRYLSSDNIEIFVGRSAKDSDDLTLHHCRGNEWWFHTKDAAGAHVIVKNSSDNLPPNTVKEAAMLAMHFSKLKADTHATIQYTKGKYVRKPKNVAAGMVLISHEKTVEVTPDEALLQTILSRS